MTFPDTTFTQGTTITSNWLNAVNDVCNNNQDFLNVKSFGATGNETHPSQHYLQLAQSKLHWGNDSPSARTGTGIVAWTQGDVCFNLSAAVGQPKGWVCTVSGTPGTWVSMGNL